ncbi:MAG: class I SAM-dependent methyltransferase [Bacteroidota bacterium]|nr:class I SAM-dependent methyltransferase [Bacteroidota bacterium]
MHTHCLLCNSGSLKDLEKYKNAFLTRCTNCRFVFSRRIPTTTELIEHYKGYPRNTDISPITIKRYHELLDSFELYRTSGNLLDIGCGDAYFLEEAKKRNWNVYGTEFTDDAVKIGMKKGITIHKGVLNPADYGDTKFDVITSFEVIEHINNPIIELDNIISILNKKGIFYFTTPNFNSLSRFMLKDKWNVIEYPEHLSYYTPQTIDTFFRGKGLKKIMLQTTGINFSRFRESVSQTEEKGTSNSTEQLREKSETKLLYKMAKKSANALLTISGLGDTIKGIYQK